MSAVWPSKLDCLTLDYNMSVEPVVKQTNFDAGNCLQRNRFEDFRGSVGARYIAPDLLSLRTFMYFHQFIISNGADRFLAPYRDGRGETVGEVQIAGGVYETNPLTDDCWEIILRLKLLDISHADDTQARLCATGLGFITCVTIDCLQEAIDAMQPCA